MLPMDIWSYRPMTDVHEATEPQGGRHGMAGYSVEAIDGSIGKVDDATAKAAILVDTGPWIFGKTVLLPAGVIDRVDHAEERVYVHRTKDEIKGAPEYDPSLDDEEYRSSLGSYYGPDGVGYRAFDQGPRPL